ncbi:MAG: RNA polymerase sigma factor [Armatimonadota bacterium]
MAWEQADSAFLEMIREHDAGAFDAFYARHREAVGRHLLRIVRDEASAEDLLQETFLRVWLRADQWDGRGSITGWLTRIATNLALNQLRSTKRRREQPLEIPNMQADEETFLPGWWVDAIALGPEALCEQRERHELLQRLVAELPEEKREVIRLVHEAEMDIHDVAATLGIPEGTVKSRLHHARKHLAREWKEWEDS